MQAIHDLLTAVYSDRRNGVVYAIYGRFDSEFSDYGNRQQSIVRIATATRRG